jgi:hypothetical protein
MPMFCTPDDAGKSEEVAAAVAEMPLGRWKLAKVNVLAANGVLFDRAGFHFDRRDGFPVLRSDVLNQLAHGDIRRKTEHHGEPGTLVQQGRGQGAAGGSLMTYDVLKQQRWAFGSERAAGNGADFAVPVDLGRDAFQFPGRFEAVEPGS